MAEGREHEASASLQFHSGGRCVIPPHRGLPGAARMACNAAHVRACHPPHRPAPQDLFEYARFFSRDGCLSRQIRSQFALRWARCIFVGGTQQPPELKCNVVNNAQAAHRPEPRFQTISRDTGLRAGDARAHERRHKPRELNHAVSPNFLLAFRGGQGHPDPSARLQPARPRFRKHQTHGARPLIRRSRARAASSPPADVAPRS